MGARRFDRARDSGENAARAFQREYDQLADEDALPGYDAFVVNVRLLLLPGLTEPINRALMDDCLPLELGPLVE